MHEMSSFILWQLQGSLAWQHDFNQHGEDVREVILYFNQHGEDVKLKAVQRKIYCVNLYKCNHIIEVAKCGYHMACMYCPYSNKFVKSDGISSFYFINFYFKF